MIQFDAEVVEVKVKKDSSQVDKIIRIVLETDVEEAVKLQEAIATRSIKVKIV